MELILLLLCIIFKVQSDMILHPDVTAMFVSDVFEDDMTGLMQREK